MWEETTYGCESLGANTNTNSLGSWPHTWLPRCSGYSWHFHVANLDVGRTDVSLPRSLFYLFPPAASMIFLISLFSSLSPLQSNPIVCHWISPSSALLCPVAKCPRDFHCRGQKIKIEKKYSLRPVFQILKRKPLASSCSQD